MPRLHGHCPKHVFRMQPPYLFKCFKYSNNFLNFYLLLLSSLLLFNSLALKIIPSAISSRQLLKHFRFFFFSNEHISQVSVNARTMPLSIIFVVLVSSYCLHQWVVTHISICILHSYWYPPLCPLCTCSYVCLKKMTSVHILCFCGIIIQCSSFYHGFVSINECSFVEPLPFSCVYVSVVILHIQSYFHCVKYARMHIADCKIACW